MEQVNIPHLSQDVCRIGLGTWAIGGWLWGGTNEREAILALHRAFDLGINFIDTAPVYGFGLSEEIVGKAIKSYSGKKDQLVIATKVGLDWKEGVVFRDSQKKRIFREVEDSLMRLGLEVIDLYQVHWPDSETPFEETAEAMHQLLESGKIRAIGVSNYTAAMMDQFRKAAPIHTLQSPYNLFEREIENQEMPYCKQQGIALIGYGSLCRGLLSGRMRKNTTFSGDDLRKLDPKFQQPNFSQYLDCIEKLQKWVAEKYNRSILELSLRWILDKGIDIALWGIRRPAQLDMIEYIWHWKLDDEDLRYIDQVLLEAIPKPISPNFMAPKGRSVIMQKTFP